MGHICKDCPKTSGIFSEDMYNRHLLQRSQATVMACHWQVSDMGQRKGLASPSTATQGSRSTWMPSVGICLACTSGPSVHYVGWSGQVWGSRPEGRRRSRRGLGGDVGQGQVPDPWSVPTATGLPIMAWECLPSQG